MHRLLPSIVFASTSLLTGCGQVDLSILHAPPDPPPPEPDASSPDAAALDAGTKDATRDATIDVALDAPKDAGVDARLCEGGWPTTKGQMCVYDGGIACCTQWNDPDSGVICCEVE